PVRAVAERLDNGGDRGVYVHGLGDRVANLELVERGRRHVEAEAAVRAATRVELYAGRVLELSHGVDVEEVRDDVDLARLDRDCLHRRIGDEDELNGVEVRIEPVVLVAFEREALIRRERGQLERPRADGVPSEAFL